MRRLVFGLLLAPALAADGCPGRISMKAFSPIADFSFDDHDLAITRLP